MAFYVCRLFLSAAVVICALCLSTCLRLASAAFAAEVADAKNSDATREDGKNCTLEVVAALTEMMPRGVAVSRQGRVFVCFPRQDLTAPYTLGELRNGTVSPYPDADTDCTH